MKKQPSKSLFALCLLFLLASCASPKLNNLKTIAPLPKGPSIPLSDSIVQKERPKLSDFFNDPKLLALYKIALASNPDIQIAQERRAIANHYLTRSKKVRLPNLDVDISTSGTRYGDYTMEGVGNFDTNLSNNINRNQIINRNFTPNYDLGLQSNWEADLWGRLKKLTTAAQNRYFASREGERLVRTLVFTDIAILYYELIALDKKLKIYEENYKLQSKAYEIIAAQRTVGKSTELAVQQFLAQTKNIETEKTVLQMELLEVENALRAILGQYDTKINRGNTFPLDKNDEKTQYNDYVQFLLNRPDVMTDYYLLQASHADAKAAKAAFLPRLVIGTRFGYQAFSVETLFFPGSITYQVLGGLMMPLFNRSQLKLEFNVANQEQEIAFWNYQKSVIKAYTELQILLGKKAQYTQTLQLKSQEVAHLNRAIDVASDLYITGYANYLELINAQKNKLNAELALLHYELESTLNTVILFKVIGGELNSEP